MLCRIDALAMAFVLKTAGVRRAGPDVLVTYFVSMLGRDFDVTMPESLAHLGSPSFEGCPVWIVFDA